MYLFLCELKGLFVLFLQASSSGLQYLETPRPVKRISFSQQTELFMGYREETGSILCCRTGF